MDDISSTPAAEDSTELFEHKKIIVDGGQVPIRLDKFLFAQIGGQSTRTRIQYAAEAGNILVNGKPSKSSYKVKPGDEISLVLAHPPREIYMEPENIPLDIVYEDQDLLVVNKKAGMVVHPAYGNYTGTLVNALLYHLSPDFKKVGEAVRPGLVHRLDKETSGLMVVAKNELALARLAKEMYDRKISRIYQALVWGVPSEAEGTIQVNIGRSQHDRKKMAAYPDANHGKSAVTHYRVLEAMGYVSLVECRLETGRTHQIRVHMKYIGHTLFGDADYGGDSVLKSSTRSGYQEMVQKALKDCPRQALHARYLSFLHPTTGKKMEFSSDLPADMEKAIDRWRKFMKKH